MNCFLIVLLVNKPDHLTEFMQREVKYFFFTKQKQIQAFFAGRIKEKKNALIG